MRLDLPKSSIPRLRLQESNDVDWWRACAIDEDHFVQSIRTRADLCNNVFQLLHKGGGGGGGGDENNKTQNKNVAGGTTYM